MSTIVGPHTAHADKRLRKKNCVACKSKKKQADYGRSHPSNPALMRSTSLGFEQNAQRREDPRLFHTKQLSAAPPCVDCMPEEKHLFDRSIESYKVLTSLFAICVLAAGSSAIIYYYA